MKVGVAREVKNREYRVALTPSGVTELVAAGHDVLVEHDAGSRVVHPGRRLRRRGRARSSARPTTCGARPTCCSRSRSRSPRSTAGCAPTRPSSPTCTWPPPRRAPTRCSPRAPPRSPTRRCRPTTARCRCSPRCPRSPGGWPRRWARTPWSARTAAAACCWAGCPACYAAKVVVIGAGVSGMNAATIALGMQAEVVVLDRDIDKLRAADRIYRGHLQTVASNAYEVERAVLDADLVIGAVLVPGRQGADAGQQRAGSPDEARLGAGRHRRRPGRLLRGHPPDHPRRPDVPGARVGLLLRGQHARRGAATPRPTR